MPAIYIPEEIEALPGLTLVEAALLAEIHNLHKAGGCFATRAHFSKRCRCSGRWVTLTLAKFTNWNLIKKEGAYLVPLSLSEHRIVELTSVQEELTSTPPMELTSLPLAVTSSQGELTASPSKVEKNKNLIRRIGPTPQQEMFEALAECCVMDKKLSAKMLGKFAGELVGAGYTAGQVASFKLWFGKQWIGREGNPPSLPQVKSMIRQAVESMPANVVQVNPGFDVHDPNANPGDGWTRRMVKTQRCEPPDNRVVYGEQFDRWVPVEVTA
jgi:hypothetical protein